MNIKINNIINHPNFWFYFRKALFQGFIPIFLGFLTFCDFVTQLSKENSGVAYKHLYFYTSLILFLHTQMRIILQYIFSICSENILLKKQINLSKTTSQLLLSYDMTNIFNDHFIITIKKIFKLRYCNSKFFKHIDNLCWLLGIDSPILIPYEIIAKLSNIKNNITKDDEEVILHTTLSNLYEYHPNKYNSVPNELNVNSSNENELLIPKIIVTQLDKSINNMQKQLFNIENTIAKPNV